MTIAEILAWLLLFAALFAALGVVDGRRRNVHPFDGALSGLLTFAIGGGLVAFAVVAVLAAQEWLP